MSARSYFFALVVNDPVLNALGITSETAFSQHDVDTPQARPFLTFHWGNTNPGMIGRADVPVMRDFQVWAHDVPGDYDRVDDILSRVKQLMTQDSNFGAVTGSGYLSDVEWMGDSDDLSDDQQVTITRYGEYRYTGSTR